MEIATNDPGTKRYQYWKKQKDIPAGGRSLLLNQSFDNSDLSALGIELANANYSDQIPPFTISLTSMNEYGSLSAMHILGVELINEGSGVSIDDIVTESQMTFVARGILGWRPMNVSGTSANVDNSDVITRLNGLTAVQQATALERVEAVGVQEGAQFLQ